MSSPLFKISEKEMSTAPFPSQPNPIDSCMIKIPRDAKSGDVLTIRWPSAEQFAKYQPEDNSTDRSERCRLKDNDTYCDSSPNLIVNITMPQNISTKRSKHKFLRVFAPWIAEKRAANTTLNSRQLRSVGVETSKGSRKSQRNRGEGNVERRSCPIGNMHQVSVRAIPKMGTWTQGEGTRIVECEKLWDAAHGAEACRKDERIDHYMTSLESFEKVGYMQTLHNSNYNFDAAKRKMDQKTGQIELGAVPSSKSETERQPCDTSDAILEGTPLTQEETESFNSAMLEHQKQFTIIAKAVGTTINRCLIHYYSRFKPGAKYLENKKIWEQSDVCEVCGDGGETNISEST